MKKLIALLVVLILTLAMLTLSVGTVAMADDVYYTVDNDKAVQFMYYNEFGEESTFFIPQGYTIAVVAKASKAGYLRVRFAGFNGVVLQSQVDALPYATTIVDLPEVTVVVDGLTAYTFKDDVRTSFDLSKDDKLLYLGETTVADIDYYAVRKYGTNEIFFVVRSHANHEEVDAAIYPKQQEETETVIEPTQPPKEETKQGFTWMRFALILGIIIPLISIIIMIVRPRRAHTGSKREIYEDAEDYDGIDEV